MTSEVDLIERQTTLTSPSANYTSHRRADSGRGLDRVGRVELRQQTVSACFQSISNISSSEDSLDCQVVAGTLAFLATLSAAESSEYHWSG